MSLKKYLGKPLVWWLKIPIYAVNILLRYVRQALQSTRQQQQLKQQDRRALKWQQIAAAPRHDVTVQMQNMTMICDSKDTVISPSLWIGRDWEAANRQAVIAILKKENRLRPGIVLDIGANIGVSSISLLKDGYFGQAIAFEPAGGNFRLLEKNVEINDLSSKITCHRVALSSQKGELQLELSPDNFGDHRVRMTPQTGDVDEQNRETETVAVETLDGFMAERPEIAKDIALIWMDIQGHEGHFFLGAENFLTQHTIPMACEIWPYGIRRSGVEVDDFCEIISRFYTHFYRQDEAPLVRRPVSEIKLFFDQFTKIDEIADIVLIRCENSVLR